LTTSMTSRCVVNLSGNHLVPLFCAHIGSAQLSKTAPDALETAVMGRPKLHHCHTASRQHILPVLSNPCSAFSSLLQREKTTESVEAMLKMPVHALHRLRLLLLHLSTTLAQTGANIVSRERQTVLWSSQSFMLFKATSNLVNSGKSTSLPSCDRISLASKAPHMTNPFARVLLRVLKCSCCAKQTTLLWRALMKTLPSIYAIRLVKPHSCRLRMHPLSSASASSKTSTDSMSRSILTPSSSHARNTSTVS